MLPQPNANLTSSSGNRKQRKLETVEIDFAALAAKIKDNLRTLYKWIAIFLALGLVVAFGSKTEYEASCELLPQKKEGALSNLGGLSGSVGLTGINLDFGSQATISPELYPQIVESLPFQLKLIHEELVFEKYDSALSAYHYFKNIYTPSPLGYLAEYTIGLPQKIRSAFSNDEDKVPPGRKSDISRLSKQDYRLVERLRKRIYVDADPETALITVEAEMPDPVAAAELTQTTVDMLLQRIKDHKVNKLQKNVKFIRQKLDSARLIYENAQHNMENGQFSTNPAQKQKLNDEYNLALETYKNLTAQLNAAQIALEEEIPVFTVVDPVSVPVDKSKPKRTIILAISLFLGLGVGVVIVFFK